MENQSIPDGWEKNVEDHIEAMKVSGNCQDFLQYLKKTFGTPQGFAQFLRIDLQKKLNQCGLSHAVIPGSNTWRIDPMKEPRLVADDAKYLYLNVYRQRIDDGIANHVAFYHAQSSTIPLR